MAALLFAFVPLTMLAASLPDDGDRALTRINDRGMRVVSTERGLAVADELIVKYKGDTTFRIEALPRGAVLRDHELRFASRDDVEYAEPNYIADAYMLPNDQLYPRQWNFRKIGMESAWDVSMGAGVVVAVLDTGVAYEDYTQGSKKYFKAPDLSGVSFVSGYDFVNNDTHPNDDMGHGTHVSGTIAGTLNNTIGVAGIAPLASIMPVKVLNSRGSGTYASVADGIRFAADNGADIINMSLGGTATSETIRAAIQYAHEKGVVIIAASGNGGTGTVGYPAAYDEYVIAVGAVRYDNAKPWYSNWGTSLDIVAPGGDTGVDQDGDGYTDGILQQTFQGSNYGAFQYLSQAGTSMAAPHVSGVAALLIAHGNATTSANVRTALQSTAKDLGAVGRDNTFGYGLVNPLAALAWGSTVVLPPGPPATTTPATTTPPTIPAEVEVFADSFEVGEWNGLWTEDAQNDWYRSNQRSTAGSRSAEFDGSATNATLTSSALALSGKSNATITFSWLIESTFDTGEYLAFDVSTDAGVTWTEKARLSGDVSQEGVWHSADIDISGISQLKIRFRGSVSSSTEDANVDAVKVVVW